MHQTKSHRTIFIIHKLTLTSYKSTSDKRASHVTTHKKFSLRRCQPKLPTSHLSNARTAILSRDGRSLQQSENTSACCVDRERQVERRVGRTNKKTSEKTSRKQSEEKALKTMLQQQKSEIMNKVHAAIKKNNPSRKQCYRCGAFKHMKKNYPQANTEVQTPKPQKPICAQCGKRRHAARECYSQTDVDENPLPCPKKKKKSPHNRQRATTQVIAMIQEQTRQLSENIKQTHSTKFSADSPATQTSSHQGHSAH